MESAEITSAEHTATVPVKRVSARAVLPEAVGPKRIKTGRALALVFLKAEFYLFGKNLLGSQRNHLALVFVDFRVTKHGKLVRPAGSSAGYLVHIIFVLNQFFQWKNHSITITISAKKSKEGTLIGKKRE
jgi:hypothetical protein